MENQILIDKAKELLKGKPTEDDKATALILVGKCIEHSETDINDFLGTEAPFNKITFDSEAKKAAACDKASMLVIPALFSKNEKPAFPYAKVIPDIAKCKVLKLMDKAKLLVAITNAKMQELLTNKPQFINIATTGTLCLNVVNAIKMYQFGTENWKQEAENKPLVKQSSNKTMVLMPSVKQ